MVPHFGFHINNSYLEKFLLHAASAATHPNYIRRKVRRRRCRHIIQCIGGNDTWITIPFLVRSKHSFRRKEVGQYRKVDNEVSQRESMSQWHKFRDDQMTSSCSAYIKMDCEASHAFQSYYSRLKSLELTSAWLKTLLLFATVFLWYPVDVSRRRISHLL